MPKNITQQDKLEAVNCLLMGVHQCHHSGCPRYLDFGVWSQERKKCPHRENDAMSEVLVQVKPWVVVQKQLHSASFRAEKVRRTNKAVLLKLRDGRTVWFPWSVIESMEEAKE